jgi:hypothetical protein
MTAPLPAPVVHRGRKLDYVPDLDDRNNDYLVRRLMAETGAPKPDWNRSVWWTGGPVLDQGSEGACVGFAATAEYAASPVRGHVGTPQRGNELALGVYNRAKEIDEWEGKDYDGTSTRAGLLVMRERKWIESFWWAKTMDEFLGALQAFGPLVIGCRWSEAQYETQGSDAEVVVDDDWVGWHALLVNGYSPVYGNKRKRKLRWRNSWDLSYGKNGNGYIDPELLEHIVFGQGGEAGVVVGRARA